MDADADVIREGHEDGHYGTQAACGDIDGDDVNDLIISADGFWPLVGRVYIYWGEKLTGSDPKPGRILIGDLPNDGFGTGLACGDINNDGFDDVVVGAFGYQVGARQGCAYLRGPHRTLKAGARAMHSPKGREIVRQMQGMEWRVFAVDLGRQ